MLAELPHVEQIETRLRLLSKLVDAQQDRSSRFCEQTLAWLAETEKDLDAARLSIAGEIAALRSRLLAEMHGANVTSGRTEARRKRREAVASRVIEEAQRALQQLLAPKLAKYDEARNIALQVAHAARLKGLIDKARGVGDHQTALRYIVDEMGRDPDAAGAVAHLLGNLGPYDALIVMDRAMPELS